MASIQAKFRKDGRKTYYVVYRIGTRQVWRRAGLLKREAKALKTQVEYELQKGVFFEPSRMSFAEYVQQFLNSLEGTVKDNTLGEYRWALDNYILPHFGRLHLKKIDKQVCQDFVEQLKKKGFSPQTINHNIKVLKRVLNRAVEEDCLLVNPANSLKPLKEKRRENGFYTQEEILRLLKAADGPFMRAFLGLAALGGLRASEISGLKWKDIDFEHKLICVRRQYQARIGYLSTKNEEERSVPMNPKLRELLQEHREELGDGPGDEDPVFTNNAGKPFTSYRKPFQQTVKRAGLKPIRFHDLRHSACSAMIVAGVPEPIVQRIMGHKTPVMTRHYTHINDSQLRQAMDIFGKALGESESEKKEGEC
jgi:integrase